MIRVSKSCLSILEKRYLNKVIQKQYLGMGPEVKKFESELEKFFERKVICVNSGSAALHLALQACGIKNGDEVLVPAITYVATYQAVAATGAKPILCDVNLNDLCISEKSIIRNISKKTKAIIPVHFSGHPCNLDKIFSIGKKYNLNIIEDSAHAFGSYYKNKLLGSFGDISCFSFDGIKNITSGEGGCIVLRNKKLIKKISDARLLGVCGDSKKRYTNKRSWKFDVKDQGWRYHMSDLNAAIGRAQLKRFIKLSSSRKKLCLEYDNFFSKENKYIKLFKRNFKKEVPHIYCIVIKNLKKRDKLRKDLLKQNIQSGIHYIPGYKLSLFKDDKRKFPNCEKISNKIITLPLHPDLKKNQINLIGKKLINLLKKTNYF